MRNELTGWRNLHYDHDCHICECICAWCESCDKPCPRSETGKPEDYQGSCSGCHHLFPIVEDEETI